MNKLLDALRHKLTTHTLALLLGAAAVAAASYASTGHVDVLGVLRALTPPTPSPATTGADAGAL